MLGAVVIVVGLYAVLWGKVKNTIQTHEEAIMDGDIEIKDIQILTEEQ